MGDHRHLAGHLIDAGFCHQPLFGLVQHEELAIGTVAENTIFVFQLPPYLCSQALRTNGTSGIERGHDRGQNPTNPGCHHSLSLTQDVGYGSHPGHSNHPPTNAQHFEFQNRFSHSCAIILEVILIESETFVNKLYLYDSYSITNYQTTNKTDLTANKIHNLLLLQTLTHKYSHSTTSTSLTNDTIDNQSFKK